MLRTERRNKEHLQQQQRRRYSLPVAKCLLFRLSLFDDDYYYCYYSSSFIQYIVHCNVWHKLKAHQMWYSNIVEETLDFNLCGNYCVLMKKMFMKWKRSQQQEQMRAIERQQVSMWERQRDRVNKNRVMNWHFLMRRLNCTRRAKRRMFD